MLLNVCCAPCSLPVIEYLISESKDISLFFYAPNIYPKGEYDKRRGEIEKVAAIYSLKLFEGENDREQWLECLKDNLPKPPEEYTENGGRCLICFRYRIDKTAKFAKDNNFDEFSTTLSINRFKDTDYINKYGQLAAENYGLKYITFPLDPDKAHREGVDLSKKLGIYRQRYCGCEFSLPKGA